MSKSLRQIFFAPTVVAVASTAGLLAALVGDDVWDVISWATLGSVVLLCVWYGLPWRKTRARR